MSRLSVVLPAYNEEQMLAKTCRTLKKILDLAEINYELVIVDDGSTDQTWKIIEETAEKDRNVTGVHFSRNFGKKLQLSQDWLRRQETQWLLWTVTCSIRRKFL